MKKILFLSGSFLSLFLLSDQAFGEQVITQNDDTAISVTIKEPTLKINSVQAPSFGSYHLSEQENNLSANKDLIIKVTDSREDSRSAWSVRYGISSFYNAQSYGEYLGENTHLSIGQGKVNKLSENEYSAKNQTFYAQSSAEIVKMNPTDLGEYVYIVPKELIHLSIDPKSPQGSYEFVQTVTLVSVPEV